MKHSRWIGGFRKKRRSARRQSTTHGSRLRLFSRRSTFELLEARTLLAVDFGDAPDLGVGTGIGDYQTLLTDNGPSHTIVAGLKLGANVDGDDGTLQNTTANADDVNAALPDDEDGLSNPAVDLTLTVGTQPRVNIRATNTTGTAAVLYGWIDYNRDGEFDNAAERASIQVPDGTNNALFTLSFPSIPLSMGPGNTYARFRLSTDLAAADPMNPANDGEVEDYVASLNAIGTIDLSSHEVISTSTTGAPPLADFDFFGSSVASLGDLDNDGVIDLAVGVTGDDTPGTPGEGAVYVLFMNPGGSIKSYSRIASGTNGVPVLPSSSIFGTSLAAIGDLDGDGITELAVGSFLESAVYILFLDTNGTAKRSVKIADGTNGGPMLNGSPSFGSSIARLGDLDGDGITELAVSDEGDDTGGSNRGAVYVLFMNSDGTAKSTSKIADGSNGLALWENGFFGASLTALGDLDSDGVTELAVGAPSDTSVESGLGALLVLFLNSDGTLKQSTKVAEGVNGGPAISTVAEFGTSLAAVGDRNSDGVPDLMVGAPGADNGGAYYFLFLNSSGSVKESYRTDNLMLGGPGVSIIDHLGTSLSTLGDLDGNGVVDVAVGASYYRGTGSFQGAVHILFLSTDTSTPKVAFYREVSPARTNADVLTFLAKFTEPVINVDESDFVVNGVSTALITSVNVVDWLTYEITVSGGILADYNGSVGLDLSPTQDVTDWSFNALPSNGVTTDQSYLLDNQSPSLLSFERFLPLTSTTSASTLLFRATFDENIENVDATDFVVTGATASISVTRVTGSVYDLVVNGGNLPDFVGEVGIDLAINQDILDENGINALPDGEPLVDETFLHVLSLMDFGDAPDSGVGVGQNNYQTTLADNGPRHTMISGLMLGNSVDEEPDGLPSFDANGDNIFVLPDKNDEEGLPFLFTDLILTVGTRPTVSIRATNTTGVAATIYGWIDYNQDGVFDNGSERGSVVVPTGSVDSVFTILFPTVPLTALAGGTYARFRLSTDTAGSEPVGLAGDGEVEDYHAKIYKISDGTVISSKNILISSGTNGGPILASDSRFGTSIAPLGDLDGDGIGDMAVGDLFGDPFGTSAGAVHVLFMNANGTVKSSTRISQTENGGPQVGNSTLFGGSIANIGDLDGNGIVDLAVGAFRDGTGGLRRGAVYILFLNPNGTVRGSKKIASGTNGGPTLANSDYFGTSIASLGDLDGDGVIDLAIGASGDDTGGSARGAVHVLFMNADGTAKSSTIIADVVNGGPALADGDRFGTSSASIGDFNGDGITDIAVGAYGDDSASLNTGAMYVLFMNANGTVQSTKKIANAMNGGPALDSNDSFGSSIAFLGDLDGDGLADLAIGTPGDDTSGTNRGAIYLVYMNADGTAWSSKKIAQNTNGGPALGNYDTFGESIVSLGDLNGDGVIELAAGAAHDDVSASNTGSIHVLFLQQDGISPSLTSITRQQPVTQRTNADAVIFRSTFNKRVLLAPSDFVVTGGSAATVSGITDIGNGIYDITVSGGNLASFNGVVGLNLAPGHQIKDTSDRSLPSTEPTIDESYLVDNIPPVLLSFTRQIPRAESTSADSLRFRATFSEDVVNVDESDFEIFGTTATVNVLAVNGSIYDITLTGGDLASLTGSVGINLSPSEDIRDLEDVNALAVAEPLIDEIFLLEASNIDFGDAPDINLGVGTENYQTTLADNGPRHTVVAGLRLGSYIDAEPDAAPDNLAEGDGLFIVPDQNDEDSLVESAQDLRLTITSAPRVRIRATNTTGSTAILSGWIDYNSDGVFDNSTERASISVPDGTNNAVFTLNFPNIPVSATTGQTYARFRLSTDIAAADPIGAATDGEVEDYLVTITRAGVITADTTKNKKIASGTNGGPTLANEVAFGIGVESIGDLDGDGIVDLAVGTPGDDTSGTNRGVVYVLLMNADGTVKSSTKIGSETNGGPVLGNYVAFGSSVALIGDLDGDGINDLAVGANGDNTGGLDRGAIYVLFMKSDGSVKSSTKIASGYNGGPPLATDDDFGSSVASLGDLDGDGISELAIGARFANTGGPNRGALYIVFLNPTGTAKHWVQIASETNGGPLLADDNFFGASVSSLGDLNGDGVSEVAVGAPSDDTGGTNRGAVYVLFLNSDGTVQSSTKIASGTNGGPALVNSDGFGAGIASLGDMDGDGVVDIAVGASGDDTGGTGRGAVHILLMKNDGSVKKTYKLASNTNGVPALVNSDAFGIDVTSMGDLDGDGVTDLAVSASGDDTGGTSRGAVHILFLKPDVTAPLLNITRQSPNSDRTNADSLVFRAAFSERVTNVSAANFVVEGGTTATATTITEVAEGVYEVTVTGGDLANFNGLVSLDVNSSLSITDASGNFLAASEPGISESYVVDNTPPALLSIARSIPLNVNTSANALRFVATFSEPVLNVDTTDFVVTGTTASLVVVAVNGSVFELTVSGGDLSSFNGIVGIDVAPNQNIVDLEALHALPTVEPLIDEYFLLSESSTDFGDAPDSDLGTGPVNYRTTLADNGPRHTIVAALKLGTNVDEEPDASPHLLAAGDDAFILPELNDEDGVVGAVQGIAVPINGIPRVRLRATNTTGTTATLFGWIDFNRDGVFDNLTERTSVQVPSGTNNGVFTLTFPSVPIGTPLGEIYARFRLSTDPAAAEPIGAATDGEVEDYLVSLSVATDGIVDSSKSKEINGGSVGGPTLDSIADFGWSVASIGDLDSDGVMDMAVGARRDSTGGSWRGAVYIQLMNPDGTVKTSKKIADGLNGGPALVNGGEFGSSVALIGDLDQDGIEDIAVGAQLDSTGGSTRGAVYILFMNNDGTVKSSTKIANATNGGPTLGNAENFGASVATLGDFNSDGVPDLVVGSPGYNSTRGAVYVVSLNSNGSVKSYTRITTGAGLLLSGDKFGTSVAAIGDLDGDGISDLAVGAKGDDTGGSACGAVHLMFLKSNGTLKSAVEIASATNGGPTLVNGDYFGWAVTAMGDIDGDGLPDVAVGAIGDDTTGSQRGAIHLLNLNADGSVRKSLKVASNLNGGPTLSGDDRFGSAITTLGDLDGDGVTDLVVGAYRDASQATTRGAVHVLFLERETTPPSFSITRQSSLASRTNADSVVFRAIFSEPVLNVDSTDFDVNGNTTATIANVTLIDSHTYDITATGGDLASYNGWVGIDLAPGHNITDTSDIPLPTLEPAIDETYLFDNIAPTLVSITRLIPMSNSTSANGLRFRAVFSETVLNVDETDFIVAGTTAALVVTAANESEYDLTLSGGDLSGLFGVVGIDLSPIQNITDLGGVNALPNGEPAVDETFNLVLSTTDFGDAPDTADGVGPGNYQTTLADNGPRHIIVPGLRLGSIVDEEPDVITNDTANVDGLAINPDLIDEDSLTDPVHDLQLSIGVSPRVRIRATNLTDQAATLYGWIDYNLDGVFDSLTESTSAVIPNGSDNDLFTLTFPLVPEETSSGTTYMRFRLSTESAASSPVGLASDGEVEDYAATITLAGTGIADSSKNKEIGSDKNGGPNLPDYALFGSSVTALGDVDGDGIGDVAVGAPSLFTSSGSSLPGSVYVLFMNADGTAKRSTQISNATNGGPSLAQWSYFGTAVAAIGDLDGDGISELAVGAKGSDLGGANRGALYILFLNADGAVRYYSTIASGTGSGPPLANGDSFGASVTPIGDFNRDGIVDLAVGAIGDDTGGASRGSVHLLYLNADGTVKSTYKIADSTNGGPTLSDSDFWGNSVTCLGDLDGDEVSDLAIGAQGDDTGGNSRGAVYVLLMNADGSVKNWTKISDSINGGPVLSDNAVFGASVASIGDIDADGLPDLAVGATGDDTGGGNRGAVYLFRLNSDGTVKSSSLLANGTNGGPTLANGDSFGKSVTSLGDFDGNGVIDLVVGAYADHDNGLTRGSIHALFLTVATPPELPGDYNLDRTVDAADYITWRKTLGSSVINYSGADGSGNGVVDQEDYNVWRAHFGESLPELPGDYNLDRTVDAADFVTWRKTLGSTVTNYSGADGSGNGVVDQEDYNVWRAHFGESLPQLASANFLDLSTPPPASSTGIATGASTLDSNETPEQQGSARIERPSTFSPKLALNPSFSLPSLISNRPTLRRSFGERQILATSRRDDALMAWLASRSNVWDEPQYSEVNSYSEREHIPESDNFQFEPTDQVFEQLASYYSA